MISLLSANSRLAAAAVAIVAMLGVPVVHAARPRVVSTTPAIGATDVDPALTEVRITFDQDMDAGMSLCGATPPKITARPTWVEKRTLVVPVALEPGKSYELTTNCPPNKLNTRSVAGEPAEVVSIRFATRGAGSGASSSALPPAPVAMTLPEKNAAAWAALQNAIANNYSYRDRVVRDWPAVFEAHRASAIAAPSPEAFAAVAAKALGGAEDVHLTLRVSDKTIGTYQRRYVTNFDEKRLRASVLDLQTFGRAVATGVIAREDAPAIGYVMIAGWPANDAAALQPAFDFVGDLGARGVDRLIVDVRPNNGGDEPTALRFAAMFAREAAVYAKHRYREPGTPGGWGTVRERTIAPAASGGAGGAAATFAGRVAVLQGSRCVSSNESFLLMMRHGAHATLVGGVTAGSSGNPKPFDLGNGVLALIPSWENFFADGSPFEGRGVVPDIEVPWPPAADVAGDPVIAAAIAALAK
jgi:hypothetical protein